MKVNARQGCTNKSSEQWKNSAGCIEILRVADLISNEILVERKLVGCDNIREHFTRRFRRPQFHLFTSFNQHRIREILINGAPRD